MPVSRKKGNVRWKGTRYFWQHLHVNVVWSSRVVVAAFFGALLENVHFAVGMGTTVWHTERTTSSKNVAERGQLWLKSHTLPKSRKWCVHKKRSIDSFLFPHWKLNYLISMQCNLQMQTNFISFLFENMVIEIMLDNFVNVSNTSSPVAHQF